MLLCQRSVISAGKCLLAYKQNTNLSMQAFTAGLLAVFFRRHKNQAPCTQL